MFNNFLRTLLIVLICSSSAVIYNSIKQKEQLDQFSNDYIWQLKNSIKEATRNFLMPAKNITKLGAYFFEENILSIHKPETLRTFIKPFIQSHPQFNGYFVGLKNKEFWFWHNTYANNYVYRVQTINKNNKGVLIEQKNFLDKNSQSIRKSTPMIAQYDPTSRLWYKGAKAVGGGFWSDVYSFNSDRKHLIPGVTASYPFYDKNHQLLGVWGVDIVLSELSDFLLDASSSRATDLVIFNEQEKVIAYSGFKNIQLKDKLITLSDLNKSTIKQALNNYQHNGFNEFYFTDHGIRYLASYSSFLFGEEKNWRLLLIVPESQLLEKMSNKLNFTLFFALLVLIISTVRFIYLLRTPLSDSFNKIMSK